MDFSWMNLVGTAYGMAQGGEGAGGKNGLVDFLFPFALIIGVMYFFVIRPQKRQAENHRRFLAGINKGDEVITSGGICGTVSGVADQVVTIDCGDKVKIKVLKTHVHPGRATDGRPLKAVEMPAANSNHAG